MDRLQHLNVFEKCLLIDALVKVGDRAQAEKLYGLIKLHKEAYEYTDVEQ